MIDVVVCPPATWGQAQELAQTAEGWHLPTTEELEVEYHDQ